MSPFDPEMTDPVSVSQELEQLERELSSIEFAERPSFDPELRAELANEWSSMSVPRRASRLRAGFAVAAAMVLVAFVVPPARAGLVRLLSVVQDGASEGLSQPEAPVALPEVILERAPEIVQDFRYEEPSPGTIDARDPTGYEAFSPGPSVTFPSVLDRDRSEALIAEHYPTDLQLARVGGTVRLQLWVDVEGEVSEAEVALSSGIVRLDRAAMTAASRFAFSPAKRYGVPVGTWVEFDVRFQAPFSDFGPGPVVAPLEDLVPDPFGTPELELDWRPPSVLPPVTSLPANARELLWDAVEEDGRIDQRWGDLEQLIEGEPPVGQRPLEWRVDAVEALEAALTRDPDNPAPFLALGRIRRTQGLRNDAKRLFDRGIRRAAQGGDRVPPAVRADLYYERGALIREEWLAWSDLGEVSTVALGGVGCLRMTPVSPTGVYSIAETLIAWNYLCPDRFAELMRERFEPLAPLKEGDFNDMMGSFYSAVEAERGHVRANVEVLLALIDQGRWDDALDGAAAFVAGSGRDPHAMLLSGLALSRQGRAEDAWNAFGEALGGMPAAEVREIEDILPLLEPAEGEVFSSLDGAERDEARDRFWARQDPLIATPVNEREVEHLARAAYAHLRFGGVGTDAGEIWVRYGEPLATRSVGEGSGLRTVFWDYGPGPDFTFRRPAVSLNLELTEEGRAHLGEFSRVFPHRYDAWDRSILPLTAQLGRFRSADGSVEMEVHTEIPAALATADGAPLEISVSLVGAEDERWIVERRQVPAAEGPLHLLVPVEGEANRLIVELYHKGLEKAATLLTPVSSETREVGMTLSDPLLVEPVAPFAAADVARGSARAVPRTRPGSPERGLAGVLFEVYDLPRDATGYLVHVEAVSLATNRVARLPFKPAGELEFRRVWERSRRPQARLTDYLTVDLDGLVPGSYLLSVFVSLRGGEKLTEASRALEIG